MFDSEADTYRFYDKDFYPNDHSMGLFESDEYYPSSYSFNVAQQNENHSFDPSPLFEKVQNEEKTEKEKSNQVTESKQKTDPTSKSLESLSVSDNESEVKEKKLLGRKIKGDTEKR